MRLNVTRRWAVSLVAVALAVGAVQAHESEQYTLPAGRDFADLGPYFSRITYQAVVNTADSANAAIRSAIEAGQPTVEVERLQSPQTVATLAWQQLFAALPTNELLDASLLHAAVLNEYPGLVTMYRPIESIYDDPLLVIDLSKPVRTFFRAGTVNVGGTLVGTDKIIHFINVGRIYYGKYASRRARGTSEAAASIAAVQSTARNPLTSEEGVLGWFTTGIHSNGDLAADYAGMKFYINLTEEVRIGPRVLPPMLVREGPYWRVQLQPDADVFTAFVTPHWNEVLNPNKVVKYVRGRLRTVVRERCVEVLEWYRGDRGQTMTRAEFEAIERDLSKYYDEPYGYQDNGESRVSVATACFDASTSYAALAVGGRASPAALARGPLWWAARAGDEGAVQSHLAAGNDPNAADLDGETPVHAAARSGNAAILRTLLSAGGNPDRPALYGVTPLQVAVAAGNVEAASVLLQGGANPNQRDLFGKTALHDAAARRSLRLTELLIANGADPSITDEAGASPLHVAARDGAQPVATVLAARGSGLRDRDAGGATPAQRAARAGHSDLARALAPATRPAAFAPSAAAGSASGESR